MTECLTVDEVILQFERAWRAGDVPSIQEFLGIDHSPQHREHLLQELIATDLEFRWKRSARDPSGTRFVEDYLRAFPELNQLAVIEEEYRARTQWGDSPDRQTYLQRF